MRRFAFGAALVSLTLATACGGDAEEPSTAASQPAPATSSAAPSASASQSAGGGSGAATVLTGTVGTADDPDAFVIALVDASGQDVTTLPAGNYQIQISDLSSIHNFHLMGGTVDETTTVPEVTDVTVDVMLEPGDYTFICDPHPRMVGEFTVT